MVVCKATRGSARTPFLKFSPELASEATAGIEPAMKVLQIDGSIREQRTEKPRNSEKSRPLTDPPRTADLRPTAFDVAMGTRVAEASASAPDHRKASDLQIEGRHGRFAAEKSRFSEETRA